MQVPYQGAQLEVLYPSVGLHLHLPQRTSCDDDSAVRRSLIFPPGPVFGLRELAQYVIKTAR
jgi:hypothetical protein